MIAHRKGRATMKALFRIALTSAFIVLPAISAFAIDGDKAIELCKVRKNCKYTIQTNGEIVIVVDGSIISCPLIGECQCTACPGPAKIVKPGKGKDIMSIPKLLQQSKAP